MSDEDAASSVPLQLPFAPILSRLMGIQQFHLLGHSRSQRLCSFRSAPRILTSGEVQFSEHAQRIHLYSRTIRSSDLILNMPRVTRSLWIVDFWCGTFQEVVIWLLVLIKRNTASRDKSTSWLEKNNTILQWREMFLPPLNGIKSVV